MGFLEATILFVTGLIAFAVLLPVGVELIPDMQNTMGSTVTLLISAMFVIILVAAFIIYVRQSQEPDRYLGGGETYP
jgi:ABC-type Na+ efflux pump permease subunit